MTEESRFTELEAKLTLAEDLLDTLNLTVFRQQEQIDKLRKQLTRVEERLQSLLPDATRRVEDDIPPHY